jgi:signal transduction histidine kinase
VSEFLHIPVNRELSDRARWLISLRWLMLTIAATVVLLANHWLGDVLPAVALWTTLLAIAVYNGIFWIVAHRLVSPGAPYTLHATLLHAQIVADLLALTVLLHFSGGIENPFSTYYVLLVAIGSILMTAKAGCIYAALASTLWVGLLVAEATGLLPHYNLVGFRLPIRYREIGHLFAESFVLVTANFAASFIAGNILDRLRDDERQLYDANASCELRAQELAELNERLRELDKSRSIFIRLVTHELRAPVAAIQSYLRLILDGYVPQERMTEILSKAEQRARDQLDLISDLLDLAHLQEIKQVAEVTLCDVAAVLADVLDMMQGRLQDKSLALETQIEPHLPLAPVNADHARQIWVNLISNAIKYTPNGGHITVMLHLDHGQLCGAVRDTGIGMHPDEVERVFETFFRTEAAKAMARHGTGLGLSIFKGLVERYGGQVGLESVAGQGSTFTFTLPCDQSQASPQAAPY